MATGLPQGYQQYSLPAMGGGQKEIYDMLKGHLSGGPSGGGLGDIIQQLLGMAKGKGDIFQQMEVPARRELDQNLANIGMQFGLSGSNKSSGFQNAISGAGQSFQENLYGQRADLMQKSIQDVLGLGEKLLGMPTEHFGLAKQSQGPDWQSLLGPGGEALGPILQQIIGKPGTNAQTGKEGIDWGNIAQTAAKFLPLILAAL